MSIWCPFPSRLCSFLGELFHEDEKSTWMNQAKSLTKCDVTNSGNMVLRNTNDQYKQGVLSAMKYNLNPQSLESVIFLFKLIGYISRSLVRWKRKNQNGIVKGVWLRP
jgi:hypothetical protein